jgi:hypothetical protein
MKIILNNTEVDRIREMPRSPFLARQHSMNCGPLCIVARNVCINPPVYSVMFLEGTGGPAIGDTRTNVTERQLREQFIPIEHSVTLSNIW